MSPFSPACQALVLGGKWIPILARGPPLAPAMGGGGAVAAPAQTGPAAYYESPMAAGCILPAASGAGLKALGDVPGSPGDLFQMAGSNPVLYGGLSSLPPGTSPLGFPAHPTGSWHQWQRAGLGACAK